MLLFCSLLISYAYLNYVFTFMVNNSYVFDIRLFIMTHRI